VSTGKVANVVELRPRGAHPNPELGLPHVMENAKELNKPSSIKWYGKLAQTIRGSTPFRKIFGITMSAEAAATSAAGAAQAAKPRTGIKVPSGLLTVGMIGLGIVAGMVTTPIATDILYPDDIEQSLSEQDKATTSAALGNFPVMNIPLAGVARFMGELWRGPIEAAHIYSPEELRQHTEHGATLNDIRELDQATQQFLSGDW
jgi:hypothetical protein